MRVRMKKKLSFKKMGVINTSQSQTLIRKHPET